MLRSIHRATALLLIPALLWTASGLSADVLRTPPAETGGAADVKFPCQAIVQTSAGFDGDPIAHTISARVDRLTGGSFNLTRPITRMTLDDWRDHEKGWRKWLGDHRRLGIVVIEQLGLSTVQLDDNKNPVLEQRWEPKMGREILRPKNDRFLHTVWSGRLPGLALLAILLHSPWGGVGMLGVSFFILVYVLHQIQFVEDHNNSRKPVMQRLIRGLATIGFNGAALTLPLITHLHFSGHPILEIAIFAASSIVGILMAALLHLGWNWKAPWWLQMTREDGQGPLNATTRDFMKSKAEHTWSKKSDVKAWAQILSPVRRLLLEAAEIAPPGSDLVILGIGAGYDIPESLIKDRKFKRIILLDIVPSVIEKTLAERGIEDSRIQVIPVDLTLLASDWYSKLDQIIDTAPDLETARQQLIEFFTASAQDAKSFVSFNELGLDESRGGLVVSSFLLGPLIATLEHGMNAKIQHRFGLETDTIPLKDDGEFFVARAHLYRALYEHHLELLAFLRHPKGYACVASEIGQFEQRPAPEAWKADPLEWIQYHLNLLRSGRQSPEFSPDFHAAVVYFSGPLRARLKRENLAILEAAVWRWIYAHVGFGLALALLVGPEAAPPPLDDEAVPSVGLYVALLLLILAPFFPESVWTVITHPAVALVGILAAGWAAFSEWADRHVTFRSMVWALATALYTGAALQHFDVIHHPPPLLLTAAGLLLSAVIHEAGHFLVARAVGLKGKFLVLKLRVEFPPGSLSNLPMGRFISVTAAGMAVQALLGGWLLSAVPFPSADRIGAAVLVLAFSSLLPVMQKNTPSDGLWIYLRLFHWITTGDKTGRGGSSGTGVSAGTQAKGKTRKRGQDDKKSKFRFAAGFWNPLRHMRVIALISVGLWASLGWSQPPQPPLQSLSTHLNQAMVDEAYDPAAIRREVAQVVADWRAGRLSHADVAAALQPLLSREFDNLYLNKSFQKNVTLSKLPRPEQQETLKRHIVEIYHLPAFAGAMENEPYITIWAQGVEIETPLDDPTPALLASGDLLAVYTWNVGNRQYQATGDLRSGQLRITKNGVSRNLPEGPANRHDAATVRVQRTGPAATKALSALTPADLETTLTYEWHDRRHYDEVKKLLDDAAWALHLEFHQSSDSDRQFSAEERYPGLASLGPLGLEVTPEITIVPTRLLAVVARSGLAPVGFGVQAFYIGKNAHFFTKAEYNHFLTELREFDSDLYRKLTTSAPDLGFAAMNRLLNTPGRIIVSSIYLTDREAIFDLLAHEFTHDELDHLPPADSTALHAAYLFMTQDPLYKDHLFALFELDSDYRRQIALGTFGDEHWSFYLRPRFGNILIDRDFPKDVERQLASVEQRYAALSNYWDRLPAVFAGLRERSTERAYAATDQILKALEALPKPRASLEIPAVSRPFILLFSPHTGPHGTYHLLGAA